MKTISDLANDAMQVQDACNLSGVVKGFDRAIADLRQVLIGELGVSASTDQINTHPICKLWAFKIADLARADIESFGNAYEACRKMKEGA